ncbi:MAG: GWxTD domain-containing protein [Bacteroidales bacterium]|jgi:GWxTD domain-containing protein|nr:GWxTD domain-containing protein [Bacteroidales bacterium]MDD2688119.1 GWxTD domain-containing protein [Bacteroidales bacterium]MDD3692175.1 GWxTD domain-containing protein [Bacteroidales bacterium]MDD4045461.1 GWxTD domain-containing protein [Bacteroidales bacterium]MDD4582488.1 GWxTD domain-containing protein [Bacteroidales bacterium]
MIRNIFVTLLVSLLSLHPVFSKDFRVNVNYLVFHIPDETSYLELQFFVLGQTLQYVPTKDNAYQAFIEIEVSLFPQDTQQSVIQKKFSFASDTYSDTISATKENIYNLFRIPLENGEYRMHVSIADRNQPKEKELSFEAPVWIDFDRDKLSVSDIQLIGSLNMTEKISKFTKNNVDFIPYFSDFYPETINRLIFMNEVYHSDQAIAGDKGFRYVCYISKYQEDKPFSNKYIQSKNVAKSPHYVILQSFDIDSLPSGNYHLHIAVYDADDSLYVMKKLFFQRSNPSVPDDDTQPIVDMQDVPLDSLLLYLDYIYTIADVQEKEFIRNAKQHSYQELDNFFLRFWSRRNPQNPLLSWYEYYNQVMIANNSYSSFHIKGYKTDRGYCYLKYGPPNEIEKFPFTPEFYPYEIWYYYQTQEQHDIMFIFYSRDLVTGYYELIHSTAKNEIYNPAWKLLLKPKDYSPVDVEVKE